MYIQVVNGTLFLLFLGLLCSLILSLFFVVYIYKTVLNYSFNTKRTCYTNNLSYECSIQSQAYQSLFAALVLISLVLFALLFSSLWLLSFGAVMFIAIYGVYAFDLTIITLLFFKLVLSLAIFYLSDITIFHSSYQYPCNLVSLDNKRKAFKCTHCGMHYYD